MVTEHSPMSPGKLASAYAEAGMSDLVVPYPRAAPPHVADPAVLDRIAADVLPDLQR